MSSTKNKISTKTIWLLLAALLLLGAIQETASAQADPISVKPITKSNYDASTCGGASGALSYLNMFQICYHIDNEGFQAGDQIAVSSTTNASSGFILNWTGVVANSSFPVSFSSSMVPGTPYYVHYKRGGTIYSDDAGTPQAITLENVAPTVQDNESGDNAWRGSAGNTYNIGFSDNGFLKDAFYRVYPDPNNGGTVIKDWTQIFSNSGASSYTTHWSVDFASLQQGINYISVKVQDAATNWFEQKDVFTVYKDTVAPTHAITSYITQPSYYNAGLSVPFSWTASDPGSPITGSGIQCFSVQFKDITAAGSWTNFPGGACFNPGGGPSFSSSFNAVEGHEYMLRVQAKDNVNNTDTYDADNTSKIRVDNTAPNHSIVALPAYTQSTSLNVRVNCGDTAPGSGVKAINLEKWDETANATPVWSAEPQTNCAGPFVDIPFSGTEGHIYHFRAQAVDNAGNTDNFDVDPGATFTQLDTRKPNDSSVTAFAAPGYTPNLSFNVAWTGGADPVPGSGLNCYHIQVRKDGGAWTDWLTCEPGNNVTFNAAAPPGGIPAGNGIYQFRSSAIDKTGNAEDWTAGDVQDAQMIVDTTVPVFDTAGGPPFVIDGPTATDITYQASNNTIEASWSAHDTDANPAGDLEHYEYAIGTTAGGTGIVNWTSMAPLMNTSLSAPGLTLTHNTIYYVSVRSYNFAGIYKEEPSNGVKVDILPPTVNMSEPNAAVVGALTFNVTWSGADGAGESGLKDFTVQVKDGAGLWTDWQVNTLLTTAVFTGVNGHTYYFRVKARDNVGNLSPYPSSPDYYVSTTVNTSTLSAPSPINDGAETGPDQNFTNDPTKLSGNWGAVTGAIAYSYAVGTTPGGVDIINWSADTTNTYFTQSGFNFADNGTTYYLSVKGKKVTLAYGTVGTSNGTKVDLAAPTCVITLPNSPYQTNTSFSVQWSSADARSGVANTDVQYKDGQAGAWTDLTTADAGSAYLFTGGVDGHTYYFQCHSHDVAGNAGVYPGGDGNTSTTVDSTVPPAPLTINDGTGDDLSFFPSLTSLSANWTASANAAGYSLCVAHTTPANCDALNWTDVGNVTSYTATGLSLVQGDDYFIRVKARNNAGNFGAPNNSDGVTIDSLKPGTPVVTDDGAFTNDTTKLHATWTAAPGISGIKEYQFAIGTSAGATDVLGWTTNGLNTTVTRNVTLTPGSNYFISVKGLSSADVWSLAGNSDGILIDTTPPTCAVAPLSAYQGSNSFSVSWSSSDAGAGIANLYYIQFKDGAGGNWSNWQTFTSLSTASFTSGIDGHTLYFQCKALDNAGNWSAYPGGNGDTSTIIASSAPAAPTVRDGVASDIAYSTSPDTISANWDAVSGAVSYIYAIGTAPDDTSIKTWTTTAATSFTDSGLPLSNGVTYIVTVRGRNLGGIDGASGNSNGVLVDTDAPTTPAVNVPDSQTSQTNFLEASWTSSDPESGIVEYQVSVGTAAGDTSVKDWYSAGVNTQISITGLSMTHGSTYYINIKAKNAAGLWSAVGSSIGVTVNTTLLSGPATINDGLGADEAFTPSNNTLSENWSAVATALSYDYAIGTAPGARNTLDWTNAGAVTTITKTGLALTQGTTYYFSVRARNSADVPGVATVSNGIRVDANPPGLPAISYANGNYSTSASSIAASWVSSAGISGIAEYQYSLGTTSGGTQTLGWTSAGASANATINASMSEGGTYYISVKAKSGAGIWSAAATYGGILVDTTAPTCSVQALPQYQPLNAFTVNWSGSDAGSGLPPMYVIQVKQGAAGSWANWLTNTSLSTAQYTGSNTNKYYFQCKAKDNAGNWSVFPGGDGDANSTVASVAPGVPAVNDGAGADIAYSTSGNTLSANWAALDNAVEYFYAIGSSPGGTDALGWTPTALTSFTQSGLALANGGTFYIAVKARNNANLYGGVGISNGVKVDTTAPTTPVVSVPDAYTSSNTFLSASWTSTDSETGVVEYQLSIGTAAGLSDTKNWFSAGTNVSMVISGLSLTNGSTYFINARAVNAAGLVSAAGSSIGVTVDSSLLPGPATVNDGTAADVDFTSSLTTLSANWTAVPGAAKYEYAIGTTPGAKNIKDWTSVNANTTATVTPLTLTNHTAYYFTIRARNAANVAGVGKTADGITVDTDKPGLPAVTYGGAYSQSATDLPASWTSAAGISGIAEFQYAVGTTAGGTNTLGWTSAGASLSATIAASLTEGGTYFISVKSKSGAGVWSDVATTSGILVDTTAPTCAVSALPQYVPTNTFTVAWSGADSGSGINAYDVQAREGTTGNWLAWRSSTSFTSFDYNGVNGKTYYFHCRAQDKAGNWSAYPAGNGDTSATVDSITPGKPVVNDGTAADIDFTSSANSISANWALLQSAGAYSYAIGSTPGGTDALNWTETAATSFTKTGLSLSQNTIYYVSVKARNNAMLYSEVGTSDGIKVDTTAPTTPQVFLPAAYTSSTSALDATWSASDTDSGISEYQLSVGSAAGLSDVKGWFTAGVNTSATISGLSLANGNTYYINVKAANPAGLWSEVGSSSGATVDTTLLAAPGTVNDGLAADENYTASTDTLSANWTAVPGAAKYDYKIGTTPGASDTLDWTDAGALLKVTKSGLALANGSKYYFTVRGRNNAGTPGAGRISNGISVDTAAPTTPAVTDDGAFTNSLTQLKAQWSATAGASGIADYQIAVGTTAGGTDIVNWTSKGAAVSGTISASMQDGSTYFISVKARNGAGVFSAAGVSNGIIVDAVKPVCAVQPLAQYQPMSSFNVSWTGTDPVSGPAGVYDVQFRDGAAGAWTDWITTSTLSAGSFSGLNTHVYYFRCRTKDIAGNQSDYNSNGDTQTTLDTITPDAPVVRDGTGTDKNYITVNNAISANWDTVLYAATYSYAIGTTPGGTDIATWSDTSSTLFTMTGLSLTNGTVYYVSVKAKNRAGTSSAAGESDGAMADTTPPTAPQVFTPAAFTSSTSALEASWNAADAESGIADFLISVGTSAGQNNVKDWFSAGANTSADITGLTLSNGSKYYINVKALNKAGLESVVGSSDAVTVDNTLLPPPAFISDGTGADIDYTSKGDTLSANWAPISGATKYQYAIGTQAGQTNTVAWTDNALNTSVTVNNLTLQGGAKYYISVRGVNPAGISGSAGSSNGTTVDTTAPSKPVVNDDGDRTNFSQPLHAVWSSQDSESPIVKYEYAVGTAAGGTDVKNWTSAGLNKEVSDGSLTLKVGKNYFISVRSANAAGLVSAVGASDGILAITTANVSVISMDNQPLFTLDAYGNIVPSLVISAPDPGKEFTTVKEVAFRESNGIGVTYDQLQRSYEIPGGAEISDPIEQISMKFAAGSETREKINFFIPVRVLNLALGGKATSIIIMKYIYTGQDDSHNQIKTVVEVPIKITNASSEEQFAVTDVKILAPGDGDSINVKKGYVAKAEISVNGAGTLSGVWLLDDDFYKGFRQDIISENKIVAEQALPADLTGQHKLQFRATMNEVKDSNIATFTVTEGEEQATKIDDFWVGPVHVTGVNAAYDPSTLTYSGEGAFKLPVVDEDMTIQFKRLKIEKKNGLNTLTRGIIALTLDKKFERGPLSIALSKILIGTDGSIAADGKVSFAGTDSLPGIGPFFFYGAGISQGGIKATVKLGSPQTGKVGFFELGITDIYFDYAKDGPTLKAVGYVTTTPEEIFKFYIYFGYAPGGAEFDYSIGEKKDWIPAAAAQ